MTRRSVDLPEDTIRELEFLARQEGTTAAELIRRLIEAHRTQSAPVACGSDVRLPLIPASETGAIQPVHGKDLDELLSRDDFAA